MEPRKRHPILERPYEYEVAELRYWMGIDGTEPFIDMTLARGDVTRRLRFFAPVNLQIESGFPSPTGGMTFLDIRDRQLDGLSVEVADLEMSHGTITFLARDVVDLDSPQ